MLSFGIRFGQGFDKSTIIKVMQTIPADFDYDFLVIGSSPGGVACAREAKLAGKKTAIIKWKKYSPAEEEGFDEDLQKMSKALEVPLDDLPEANKKSSSWNDPSVNTELLIKSKKSITFDKTSSPLTKTLQESKKSLRKVRQSRLDLTNELFKRGQQCRKLMHNATMLGDVVENAYNSGWRLPSVNPPLSVNWSKMSEEIMDYVMKENWTLVKALNEENIEIIEGSPTLLNDFTVKIKKSDMTEIEITSSEICLALSAECILPEDVEGAKNYGITCDDFIRLSERPGKTLVVGSLPESLECAGILACSKNPVTVVSRSKILKGYDSEISEMIIEDLKLRGIKFLEKTTLKAVRKTSDDKIMASFLLFQPVEDSSSEELEAEVTQEEWFDSVLFAVGRKVLFDNLNLKAVRIELEPGDPKIKTDLYDKTVAPNIYAVGDTVSDRPESFDISELAGKFLGKRLFHGESELLNYAMIPSVMFTPTEYAFVGLSEDSALDRLGLQCIEVYYGHFKPLDFVIPPKKGECFAKIIVLKQNDSIIGLHIFGPEAGEMIQGFAEAIKMGLTMSQFRKIFGITGTKIQEILKIKNVRTAKSEEETSLLVKPSVGKFSKM